MSSYRSNISDKTIASSFPNYSELPGRRTRQTIGDKSYEICVLKHKEANLGFFRRVLEGIGLFIFTGVTLGFALRAKHVKDRWKEVADGHGVKYIKIPLTELDRRLSSSSISLLGIEGSSSTKTQKTTEIARALESLSKHGEFAGAVLVVDHGKVVLNSGYGQANVCDEPVSTQTRFPIGSLTKPITSFIILKLIKDGFFKNQEGQPIYDSRKIKILDFLPASLQPNSTVRESWSEITLSDLMNHTAGLPSFQDKGEEIMQAKGGKMSNPLEPNDVIGLILDEPLQGKGVYRYSNFGYHILGKIIEEVTHQSYESFINQYFHNLGLSETGYCQDKIGEGFAEPLDHRDENFIAANKDELDHPIEGYSSGGLYSNIADLYLLFSKQIGQQGILLQKEDPLVSNVPEFRQSFRCANGLNITEAPVTDSYEKPSQEIWKSGAVGGYGSYMIFYPNHSSSIIVLSNQPEYIEVITSQLSHVLFSPNNLEENDPLSAWQGAYGIPSWKRLCCTIHIESDHCLTAA